MTIADKVKSDIFEAMKAKDELRKNILRVALGDINNQVANAKAPNVDEISEKVIRKIISSNEEVIKALTEKYVKENEILSQYLPKTLDQDEIFRILENCDGVLDCPDDGPAIGIGMRTIKKLGLHANGSDVKTVVERIRFAHEQCK